tara:strand:- start:265 stop:465 length:201 start_codon:yes stop_codon:yes gene_type:complete
MGKILPGIPNGIGTPGAMDAVMGTGQQCPTLTLPKNRFYLQSTMKQVGETNNFYIRTFRPFAESMV